MGDFHLLSFASLPGARRFGSSTFRPSTHWVLMPLAGSRFSSKSALCPSIMGFEDLPLLTREGTHDAGGIEVRKQLGGSRRRPVLPADGGGRHHIAATLDSRLVRSDGLRDRARGNGGGVERGFVGEQKVVARAV